MKFGSSQLLHKENPDREDFSVEEIRGRAHDEHATESLRPGFNVHVIEHCVANRAPNSGRYRMLIENLPRQRRRLFSHRRSLSSGPGRIEDCA